MDDERWQQGDQMCLPRSFSSRKFNRFVGYDDEAGVITRPKTPIWRVLWRRIKKEKQRMFPCSTSSSMSFSYDPNSYSQNFDQGFMWADPDDLSRSFSARFAVSSRIFQNNALMV